MIALRLLFLAGVLSCAPALAAKPAAKPAAARKAVRFAVLAHRFNAADEAGLQESVAQLGRKDYAFIVANGIKAGGEPCDDTLYSQRRRMLDAAHDPVIVALAGEDWVNCRNGKGRSNAIERLNRLRELFYPDNRSLGRQDIELNRLSETAKFRGYAEYAHWQIGKVLFATINLPSPNNNYRADAGRNSEFEDRAVANREWLARLLRMARLKKLDAVVLFSDADIFTPPPARRLRDLFAARTRDGFQDVRRQLEKGMQQFDGRVLLVDNERAPAGPDAPPRKPASGIEWRGKLGHVSVADLTDKDDNWLTLRVDPEASKVFVLERERKADAEAQ